VQLDRGTPGVGEVESPLAHWSDPLALLTFNPLDGRRNPLAHWLAMNDFFLLSHVHRQPPCILCSRIFNLALNNLQNRPFRNQKSKILRRRSLPPSKVDRGWSPPDTTYPTRASSLPLIRRSTPWLFWNKSSTAHDVRTTKRPTQRELVRSVDTPVLFFAVCGPKFTKSSTHAQERLHFVSATPFPFDHISSHSGDIRDQVGPNFDVFEPPNFLERGPKFSTQFYKFGSPSYMCRNLVGIDNDGHKQ